jgi:hypothetical protein
MSSELNAKEPILALIANAKAADSRVESAYQKTVSAVADWIAATRHFNEKPGFWRRERAGWRMSNMKIAIDNLQMSINVALKRPDRTLSPLLGPFARTWNQVQYIFEVASVLEPAAEKELLARQSKWAI